MISPKFHPKLQLCTCRKCRRHSCTDHKGKLRQGCYLLPRTALQHREAELSSRPGNVQNLSHYEASILFVGASGHAAQSGNVDEDMPSIGIENPSMVEDGLVPFSHIADENEDAIDVDVDMVESLAEEPEDGPLETSHLLVCELF